MTDHMTDVLIRHIENGATKLLVLTPEEFLYEFNSSTYVKPHLLNMFKSLIPSLTLINQGGLGRIYTFGPDHVLKITNTCIEPIQNQNKTIQSLCNMARTNSIVYKIENTLMNKEIVFCPNYYSEGIIGSLLQNLRLNTPSFVKINGSIIDNLNPDLPMYIVMERAQSFPYNEPDQQIFMYYIFQIIFALYIAQYTMKFTHYDLHGGNILSKPRTDGDNIKKYIIRDVSTGETKYLYTKHNIDALIIDFGFSRCETEKHIIVPRYELVLNERTANERKASDGLEFNPYYDIASLLNSMRLNLPERSKLAFDLLNIYLQWRPISDFFIGDFWRPMPEKLYENRIIPIYRFLDYICRNYFRNTNPENITDLNNELETNNFIYSNVNINLNPKDVTYQLPGNIYDIKTYIYKPLPINELITGTDNYYQVYTKYSNKMDETMRRSELGFDVFFKPYNFNPNRKNTLEQYITFVTMDQPSDRNPYRFRTDCCRLDMRTYFENNIFKEGVAINASYFRINEDFEAVGLYKSNDYITDNPIPAGYEEYYASIVIDSLTNNLSVISVENARNNINKYSGIITTGPLIIRDRESLITPQLLATHRHLQCRQPIEESEVTDTIFSDGIPNCNKIIPGELKHISNQNPRSVLLTGTFKGKNVVSFVYIEGRDRRGSGMDIAQVSDLLLHIPDLIINAAINLDGGWSSSITMLQKDILKNNVIYIANPNKFSNYPIGNVLSYAILNDPVQTNNISLPLP
jgi:hypothetical protein